MIESIQQASEEIEGRARNLIEDAKRLELRVNDMLECMDEHNDESKELLKQARSIIRDMVKGSVENDLEISPKELVNKITDLLGDNYDFELE